MRFAVVALCAGVAAGFAPTMMLQQRSQLALSKVWMCDAPEAEEAPAEDGAVSVLDDLSAENAAMLEQIKGLTLSEAAELIKEAEEAFNVGPKADDEEDEE